MATESEQAWATQSDDVFDAVADIDPPSARIRYAFLVGYKAAGDCQQAVDNVKADYEKRLRKQIHFICQDCSEAFAVPLFGECQQRIDDIMAPALCERCGHGAED